MKRQTWTFGNICLAVGAAIIMLLSSYDAAYAQQSYPSKPIKLVVTYRPGGGFDTYARAVSPYWQKHLPGSPAIVIKNVPGAGGRKGATMVYRAKPDGYTIGLLNIPGLIVTQLIQKAPYDMTKVRWIGRIDSSEYALFVSATSPYATIDDFLKAKKGFIFGLSGTVAGGTDSMVTAVTSHLMGIEVKDYLGGYGGSQAMAMGAVRGDSDAFIAAAASIYPFVESGDLRMLMFLGPERYEKAPNVPTVAELGYPELANFSLNRVFGAPPDTPGQIVNILQDSLMKAMTDPKLLEWSRKADRPIKPLDGAQTAKLVSDSTQTFNKYMSIITKLMDKR
jgi:tripartite-type tricarboxylate transporter receptor subunit TctC